MDGKTLRLAVGLAALALAIFLTLLWQPARQVRLHQRHLLQAVEKRAWPKVRLFIAAEYHDRWGYDKENVLAAATQVFGQFIICHFEAEERSLALSGGTAIIAQRLTLGGTGGPFAELAKSGVNRLSEPFTFKWMRQSWKPWDWALTEVEQPQLEIGDLPSF